ncbi:MAG: glycosyltransferase [Candidatus Hydrogenedentes bacterium]|nr:glycosyltransferase [Candidatus Hydrogenedentota bacterium]
MLPVPQHPVQRLIFRGIRRTVRSFDVYSRFTTAAQIPYHYLLDGRDGIVARDFSTLRGPGQKGLVSLILPVYNGEAYLEKAVESIRNQSYEQWELILVDDGSTDGTAALIHRLAAEEPRIRPFRQDNQKLPAALNAGHKLAQGEFVTWTSCDNRLKANFLEVLVADLQARPWVDMVFGDMEVINERGEAYADAPYYPGYQYTKNPGEILLPGHVSLLHRWNCVGAAFLYRREILALIGTYSTHQFTCEDYDFWLRVNAQLCLRHSKHHGSIYQYRIHDQSLTAQSKTLNILDRQAALLCLDEARRDIISCPMAWQIESDESAACQALAQRLKTAITDKSHALNGSDKTVKGWVLPQAWVYICESATALPESFPTDCHSAVLLVLGDPALPPTLPPMWTLAIYGGSDAPPLPALEQHRGWIATDNTACLVHAIQCHTTARFCAEMERKALASEEETLSFSVIICTNREPAFLARCLDALRAQSLSPEAYEILVVNNAPELRDYTSILNAIRNCAPRLQIREIACQPPGLSHARNAGLRHASGRIIVYVDDDSIAEANLLEVLQEAYAADPEAAIIGGAIDLMPPDPMPRWFGGNLTRFWSQLTPKQNSYYRCYSWMEYPYGANWSARRDVLRQIGGFRSHYGAGGRMATRGEETVAALAAARLGKIIAIEPRARVLHAIEAERFTLSVLFRTCRESFAVRRLYAKEGQLSTTMKKESAFFKRVFRFLRAGAPNRKGLPYRVEQLAMLASLWHSTVLFFSDLFCYHLKRPVESRRRK